MSKTSGQLAEALHLLERDPPDYAIPESVLERWRAEPEAVSDEEFRRYSDGGYVFQGSEAIPCPVTSYRQERERAFQSMRVLGIPERYLSVSWDDLNMVEPFPRLKRGAQHIDRLLSKNASLMLYGPSSSGKTQSAMLLAKAALGQGATVRVINLADMAIDVREGYDDDTGAALTERKAIDELTRPQLLVLEDLGAAETDNAAVEKRLLYHAAEKRQNTSKPIIVTTNLSPPELQKLVGGRILGRLQPLSVIEFSHGLNFRAPDPAEELW